jgi:hypothetical protein
MLGCRDVLTVSGKIHRRVCLAIFSIAIRQFAYEVCLVPSLRPCLTQIQTNRPR